MNITGKNINGTSRTLKYNKPSSAVKTKLVGTRQVAKTFQVTTRTVRRWLKEGKIRGFEVDGNQNNYFDLSEVKGLPIRQPLT